MSAQTGMPNRTFPELLIYDYQKDTEMFKKYRVRVLSSLIKDEISKHDLTTVIGGSSQQAWKVFACIEYAMNKKKLFPRVHEDFRNALTWRINKLMILVLAREFLLETKTAFMDELIWDGEKHESHLELILKMHSTINEQLRFDFTKFWRDRINQEGDEWLTTLNHLNRPEYKIYPEFREILENQKVPLR